MKYIEQIALYRYDGSQELSLDRYPTSFSGTENFPGEDFLVRNMKKAARKIASRQEKLFAEAQTALLVIFQGMDAAGKDGTIRSIFKYSDPQGVRASSFKQPTTEELKHDFIWRAYKEVPAKGMIGVFNRSYYEDVLISRVHTELILKQKIRGIKSSEDIGESFWESRYEDIRNFEKILTHNGTRIVKIFLHLSKDEQLKRLLERVEIREKNWKFSPSDLHERQYWDEYQWAYRQAIARTARCDAPWFIVPADDKDYARWAVAKILSYTLEEIDPKEPVLSKLERLDIEHYRSELEREAAEG